MGLKGLKMFIPYLMRQCRKTRAAKGSGSLEITKERNRSLLHKLLRKKMAIRKSWDFWDAIKIGRGQGPKQLVGRRGCLPYTPATATLSLLVAVSTKPKKHYRDVVNSA